jgi:D-alanine-D-alanine ligase
MTKDVAVLMGGWSSEREVSLVSGAAVAEALRRAGYGVRAIDVGRDMGALLAALRPKPDVVFNALHGRFGEDGCIQGLLDILAIPYTHSGVLASALAMDKPMAKHLFTAAGVPCARHVVVDRETAFAGKAMDPPYVIKPMNEGSSVGVHIVLNRADLARIRPNERPAADRVMVERYVPGREITVAVMGDRALAVTEIRPRQGFYDYSAKYTAGLADHLIPAPMPPEAYEAAMRYSVMAHQALGCRGVSRADLRYDDTKGGTGEIVLLEVNTQPGMTPLSLVPEQALHVGIDFTRLVEWMVENAACDG